MESLFLARVEKYMLGPQTKLAKMLSNNTQRDLFFPLFFFAI